MTPDPAYWTGKTVWVTGASSGIGNALALEVAHRGAHLVLSGRREEALRDLAAGLATGSLILPFDVTDERRLPGIVDRAWAWRHGVDLLVNNAGVSQLGLARDTIFDVYRRVMEVDFFAPVHLTQLILPRMIDRGYGHVAMVGSTLGKSGSPLRSAYAAAKHALMGYCDSLRGEVELAHGVRVSTILPGSVRTQVTVNALSADGAQRGISEINIDNGMDPRRVARIAADALGEGSREILIAQGAELADVRRRHIDPEGLFDDLAREGVRLSRLRADHAGRFVPEPLEVR